MFVVYQRIVSPHMELNRLVSTQCHIRVSHWLLYVQRVMDKKPRQQKKKSHSRDPSQHNNCEVA